MDYKKVLQEAAYEWSAQWTAAGYDTNVVCGLDPWDYEGLIKYISEHRPMHIVEYGSGKSTYIIDKLLTELDYGASFISFEEIPYWYEKIKTGGMDVNDRVHLVPITVHKIQDLKFTGVRYEHSLEGLENTDFVLLDGPDLRPYNADTTLNLQDIVEAFDINPVYWIDGRKGTKQYYNHLAEKTNGQYYQNQLYIDRDFERWPEGANLFM